MPTDWVLQSVDECSSTNDAARDLPMWHAVSARRQSAGRGRLGRVWQSGEGGAWLSAVLPAPIHDRWSKLMPLAAGYSVSSAIKDLGASDIRLRWPNDVMSPAGKCAGILVDRFHPDRCVVGIGVNVFNDPAREDRQLKGHVTRIKDLVETCPSVEEVIWKILKQLRQMTLKLESEGSADLIQSLQAFWKIPTRVQVTIEEKVREGNFMGVDREGGVLLDFNTGSIESYSPDEISLLREI